MNYKNLFQTKSSNKFLYGIGALVVALLIFQVGIFVGYKKASFSYGSGDNFYRMFGATEHHWMMNKDGRFGVRGGDLTSAYGTTGTIVKISLPIIVVAGTDKVEKVIVVDEKTIFRHLRNNIVNTDLKVGDTIIVIGAPNSASQIEAKLIRVLPSGTIPSLSVSTTTK